MGNSRRIILPGSHDREYGLCNLLAYSKCLNYIYERYCIHIKHKRRGGDMRFIWLIVILFFISGCGQTLVLRRPGPPSHPKAYGHQKKYVYHYYPVHVL